MGMMQKPADRWIENLWLGTAAILALAYLLVPDQLGGVLAAGVKSLPIWILAWLAYNAGNVAAHRALALAFLFSGFGDLFLSLSFGNNFAFGMGAFLLAQIAFIICFWPQRQGLSALSMPGKAIMVLVILLAITLGAWLLPLAGPLAPALMVYFGALTLMVLLALGGKVSNIAKIGAVLFLLSDSLIGIDRFAHPLPERHLLVMGSYYLAQMFLFWGMVQKRA